MAPRTRIRRIVTAQGDLQVLLPAERPGAVPLGSCLDDLRSGWLREGGLAALWQAWPRIAGPQLAPHCRPLALRGNVLLVAAAHPQWLQALRYNRHQLLGALRGAGFSIRDLRFQHHGELPAPSPDSAEIQRQWERHPSRVDVHGMEACPACGSPAPAGELARWGHCGFCRRSRL